MAALSFRMLKVAAIAAVMGLGLTAAVADAHGGGKHRRAELMKQFDTNGDGQLDQDEKQAAKAAFKQKREARRAEMLQKYDANGDGQLDAAERQKARSERAQKRFQALDTDGNGVLSLSEFEAGMGKRRQGRK